MFVPAHPQRERKRQTRKREADQINDCFTRPSLRERRRWLSPSEIARRRKRQRKWKWRKTCQTRNQRVLCVILTLGEEKVGTKIDRRGDVRSARIILQISTTRKKMWRIKILLQKPLWSNCELCFFNTRTNIMVQYKFCFIYIFYIAIFSNY